MLSDRTALRAATEGKKRSVILSRRSAHSRVHREGVRSTVEGSGRRKSQSLGDRVSSAQIFQCAPYALAVRLRGRTAPPQDDRVVDSRNPHKYWEFLRSRRSAPSRLHREGVRSAIEASGWGNVDSRENHDSAAQIVRPRSVNPRDEAARIHFAGSR